MNNKVFKLINQFSGRCSPIDLLMILISNKIRYVFIFVLIFLWFRNDSYKKVSCNAVKSMGITWFIHTLIKVVLF